MAAVHGVGPTIAMTGGLVTICGLLMWMRLSNDESWSEDADGGRRPRLRGFNARLRVLSKTMSIVGVPIGVLGLIIWAAS